MTIWGGPKAAPLLPRGKLLTGLVLKTPPAAEPLTAAEVRARLGLSDSVSDAMLTPLIKGAREKLDGWSGWLGRALITQTWVLYLPAFCASVSIPLPPLQQVVSVKYIDADGVEQTLDAASHRVIAGSRPVLQFKSDTALPATAFSADAVRIEFRAGYGDGGASVPEPIRNAMVLDVHLQLSMTARNLFLSQDKVEGVSSKSYVVGGNAGAVIDAAVAALISNYRVPA